MSTSPAERGAEPDDTLVRLARTALSRLADPAAGEAAAVRDDSGRTHLGGVVALPSLRLSALQVAVATAAASGATRVTAAVLAGPADPDVPGLAAVRDLGSPDTVLTVVSPDGTLRRSARLGPAE
jgi:hypothetical protein